MLFPNSPAPGSRVVTTSRPEARRRSAIDKSTVDFPAPSGPSNVMNIEGIVPWHGAIVLRQFSQALSDWAGNLVE